MHRSDTPLLWRDVTPANGLNGAQLFNPFAPDAVPGEIDRTQIRSTTTGASLQATNSDELFGHTNRFVIGTSFDYSTTRFNASAELGTYGSGIFLGQSGNPVSIGPVALRTTNQYSGLYALDTFDVTKAFSITAGGRFNDARIAMQDQLGTSLNGSETFIKASIDYSITDALKVGGDALYVSSQYFVGDESNQASKLPGYVVFNLRDSYQINKTFQIYGRINNVFR